MALYDNPDSPREQSLSKLTSSAQEDFKTQQVSWERSAAKRELLDLLHLKLVSGDDCITALLKQAHQTSTETAELLLRPPPPRPGEDDPIPDPEPESPVPVVITTHLRSPFPLHWTWNSVANNPPLGVVAENAAGIGILGINLRTNRGRPTESARAALGGWHTPSRTGSMSVTASTRILYGYGNSGFLRSTHTHAWVGIVIQQFKAGVYQRDVIAQQNNLWDLTTDHDFTGDTSSTQFATIPAVAGYDYAVWIWTGGNVESNALSYGNVNLTVSDIVVRLF